MENAFKVKTKMKLSLTDQIIYSLISCYSDARGTSHISRQKLAEKSGIKKLDTITRHTNALAKKGLIRKTHTRRNGKKLAQYHLINPKQDFMWVSNDVFKYGAKTAGFLIKLAELR